MLLFFLPFLVVGFTGESSPEEIIVGLAVFSSGEELLIKESKSSSELAVMIKRNITGLVHYISKLVDMNKLKLKI